METVTLKYTLNGLQETTGSVPEESPVEESQKSGNMYGSFTNLSEIPVTEEVENNNEKRPKSKKRVTFEPDESLVRVQEIPRVPSPAMTEEMAPCDPSKLAAEVERMYLSSVATSSSSIDLMSQISKMGAASRSPNQRNGKQWYVNGKKKSQHQKNEGNAKKGSQKYGHTKHSNGETDYYSEHSVVGSKTKLHVVNKKNEVENSQWKDSRKPQKLGLLMDDGRRHVINKSVNKQNLSLDFVPENYNKALYKKGKKRYGSASESHKVSESFPRLHRSPYRQSSAPPTRPGAIPVSRSQTFPGGRWEVYTQRPNSAVLRVNGIDTSSTSTTSSSSSHLGLGRIDPLAPGRVKKVYAWQMANGDLSNNQVNTPCISQLWEAPRQTIDLSSIT